MVLVLVLKVFSSEPKIDPFSSKVVNLSSVYRTSMESYMA